MLKVTCACLFYKNKVLLTQRGVDSDHPFLWEFPGGKIKAGENAIECIVREIKEELEIEMDILGNMYPVKYDYGFKKIELIPFLGLARSSEIKLNDHIQFKWIDWNCLNEIALLEADKKLIQQKDNRKILKKYFGKKVDNPRKYTRPSDNG